MIKTISGEKLKISRKNFTDVVAISVKLENEDMTVAAYGDSLVPSVILTSNSFQSEPSSNQRVDFKSIKFRDFEGYRVWCCDIEGDELKVCMVR